MTQRTNTPGSLYDLMGNLPMAGGGVPTMPGFPGIPGSAPATPGGGGPLTIGQPKSALESMLEEADRLASIEDDRYGQGLGQLKKATSDFSAGYLADEDRATKLALGGALDSGGRSASDALSGLRTSLGARGINAGSGVAADLAGRIGLQKESMRYGAMRQAAQDSFQRRTANRAAEYANQQALVQYMNQSPSMIRLDARTDAAGYDLARYAAELNAEAARYGADAQRDAGKMSGIGSIVGGLIPG